VLALSACASTPTTTTSGSKLAPPFTLTSLDGTVVDSATLWADQSVLVVFMASWCEPCRDEVPELNALAKTHQVVAIASADSHADLQRVRRETGITYPILLDDDGAVSKAYGIEAIPASVVVLPGGVERARGQKPPADLP